MEYVLIVLFYLQQDCEDLRKKVKTGLLPKLTVVSCMIHVVNFFFLKYIADDFNFFFPCWHWKEDLQEKATSLHEDITKHVFILDSMHANIYLIFSTDVQFFLIYNKFRLDVCFGF